MKGLIILLVFVSFNSFAQVKENIKVKHQTQYRAKYVPETFQVEETKTTTQKAAPSASKNTNNGNGKKK